MDLNQLFGNDISVSQTGDLLLVDGVTLTQQRILRRLLTIPGTYLFDLNYGAGLPQFIGQTLTTSLYNIILGLITSNMYLETTVVQTPPPVITLTADTNNLFVNIKYNVTTTQTLQVLSFTVSNT